MTNEKEPFQLLANGIVIQAAKDYRNIQRILKKNPNHSRALEEKKSIESFFTSNYFGTLTKINGTKVLTKLQEEKL